MMQYKGYLGRVEYDADARLLHGEVAGLRDVITFQASSVSAIEKAFRDSVDDYLAYCRKRGEKPEKPYSGQFIVRAGAELHRELVANAHAAGKSLNSLVIDLLEREVRRSQANSTSAPRHRRRKSA